MLYQEVVTVLECEAKSSRGKSLWDTNFGILAHGKSFFLPLEDKTRLEVQGEDLLCRNSLKLLGQAFALACMVDDRAQDRQVYEDQKNKGIADLHKGMDSL